MRDRLPEAQVTANVDEVEPSAEATPAPEPAPVPPPAEAADGATTETGPTAMDTSEGSAPEPSETSAAPPPHEAPQEMNVVAEEPVVSEEQTIYAQRLARLKGILSGETPINLTLQFLYSNNR